MDPHAILLRAADTPAQLRRCDVYRVLALAADLRCLAEFRAWLLGQRPDLEAAVADAAADLPA